MNFVFNGKAAVVTGAAHGFARSIAQGFTSRGAFVIASAWVPAALEHHRW